MAARPGALACQAQLYGALTDWFLARRDVREEEKMEGRGERGQRSEMRWGGLVNDEDSARGESAELSQLESTDEEEIILTQMATEKQLEFT